METVRAEPPEEERRWGNEVDGGPVARNLSLFSKKTKCLQFMTLCPVTLPYPWHDIYAPALVSSTDGRRFSENAPCTRGTVSMLIRCCGSSWSILG